MKFYHHDLQASRLESSTRQMKAEEKGVRGTDEWFAENALLKLQDVAERGLPDCYSSFKGFLCDFYPDLSWTPHRSKVQARMILSDDRFADANDKIKKEWFVDMRIELTQAIEEWDRLLG